MKQREIGLNRLLPQTGTIIQFQILYKIRVWFYRRLSPSVKTDGLFDASGRYVHDQKLF